MPLLGGFLQQVGLAAGRNVIVGQELESQQADTQYKQALTAQQKMATMTMQREQDDAKQIGSYIKSEQDKDSSTITDPVKAAKLYQQGEGIALQNGDFKGAELMANMAKGKLNESIEQAKVVAQQQQVKKEALSTAATDYDTNPTPEGAAAVAKAAVDAGVNPTAIPAPGTPAFKAWINQQKTASMSGKERVEFAEKTAENQARIAETRQAHEDAHQDRVAARQQAAAIQQGNLDLRRESLLIHADDLAERRKDRLAARADKPPVTKSIAGKDYEYDPSGDLQGNRLPNDNRWVQVGGEKLTAQQKSGISRAFASGAEISRGLDAMDKLPQGTAVSPFSQLHATNMTDALAKIGTNQLTPAQVQMMGVSSKGLGVEFGNLLAAMGGRSPNQSVMNELQEMSTPIQGDTGYTAMYKRANAADIVRTYINNLPGDAPNDPRAKKILKQLDGMGDADEIRAKAAKAGFSRDLSAMDAKADRARRAAADAAQDSGVGLPGTADPAKGAASAPPLPAGWSVKVH